MHPPSAALAALRNVGVRAALVSALLFGAGAPAAKLLLRSTEPLLLAGLLYLGSGVGISVFRVLRRAPRVRPARADLAPLAGSILSGGIIGPVLLLLGLSHLPASGASLLLNAEGIFTATLAWFVFRENVDRRVAAGMLAIVAGAVLISIPAGVQLGSAWPSLAVLGACLAWGLDNNLTRKVALTDAGWLAAVKGLVAGPVNLTLAFATGATLPSGWQTGAAMVLGLLAYGVSLILFIIALRHVGTARAGAYFSVAPFFGAGLAVALGDKLTWPLVAAAALMGLGIWLHLTEGHEHRHRHAAVVHDHWHTHDDEHHEHAYTSPADGPVGAESDPSAGHRHQHRHLVVAHTHQHFPDSHHRHQH